jgi:putative tributyrin esterase
MKTFARTSLAILLLAFPAAGCRRSEQPPPADHPRLSARVEKVDVAFFSSSLGREIQCRIVLPADYRTRKEKLPVLYLLHGGGGGFRDWTNYSDVAAYAEKGFVLVMPEGNSSYYMNAAGRPQDRYEDYVTQDLLSAVERQFPVSAERQHRAIAGVSMGGFGAIVLGLKHPELFAFAAGLSPALDVPTRPFSVKRISQWRSHRAIFGPWKGERQRQNDPYLLITSADPQKVPYLFLSCGEQEGLLAVNRRFVALLERMHFPYEFHAGTGSHDWNQGNMRLPALFASLAEHMKSSWSVTNSLRKPTLEVYSFRASSSPAGGWFCHGQKVCIGAIAARRDEFSARTES